MEEKLIIGLDIHGVTDTHPFFKAMASAMSEAGHEIHIITGASLKKAENDLEKLGMLPDIHYHCIFSITDHLISKGVPVTWRDPDNPVFPDKECNECKSKYCAEYGIDIHFDDSNTYGEFFTTPYAQVKS
jgi:hypothetical protein